MYEYFIGQLLGKLHNMKQYCSSLVLLNKVFQRALLFMITVLLGLV